jgi:hypothetical protein
VLPGEAQPGRPGLAGQHAVVLWPALLRPACTPLTRVRARAVRSAAWRLSSHDERSRAQPASRPWSYLRYQAQMQSFASVATGPSSATRKHDRSQALRK